MPSHKPRMSSVLRIAYTLTWDPKIISDGIFNLENTTYYFHGSGVSVIPDIAEMLNLTIKTSFGEYTEAFDMVANGSADMGGLLMSQDSKWVDRGLGSLLAYLHPLDSETSNVYFRQPPSDSAKHTIARPFSTELWIVLLVMMLLVSLISKQSSDSSIFTTFCRTIIHAIELLIGRPYIHFRLTRLPTSIAIARLIISFFCIIITSAYIAKIASIFVVKENLAKSPDDLIKYKYKLNTYSTIHVNRVFEKSKKKNATANLVDFTKEFSFIAKVIGRPIDDPRKTLFSHPDGFYANALYSLNYNKELCQISVLKSIRKTSRSFYIGKESPFREAINLSIVKLIERGMSSKYVELGFLALFIGSILAVVLGSLHHLIMRTTITDLNTSKIRTNSKQAFLF